MLINQIKLAQSRKGLRDILSAYSLVERHEALVSAIDSLNAEVEFSLSTDVDSAIFKMSQVVMLEDEKHIVERVLLKQSVSQGMLV